MTDFASDSGASFSLSFPLPVIMTRARASGLQLSSHTRALFISRLSSSFSHDSLSFFFLSLSLSRPGIRACLLGPRSC